MNKTAEMTLEELKEIEANTSLEDPIRLRLISELYHWRGEAEYQRRRVRELEAGEWGPSSKESFTTRKQRS